jgi:hypothetical protein
MSTPEARPAEGVVADQRGAILVMGIFMCACLVSILWYLAGIGDAVLFRERMQEAADATAYTAAVLHARGMNLLVMMNLIMACVLAVRVALKVAYIVLNVLAIAFSWVPGVNVVLRGLAQGVNIAQKASDPFITGALEGLTAIEEIVPHVVPLAAIAGSYQVGSKYRPIVKDALAGNPTTTVDGLPVTNGDKGVLCFQAGKAVVDIIFGVIPGIGEVKDYIGGAFGELVAMGGDYFCGLGGSSKPPDLSGLINGQTKKGCDEKKDKLEDDLSKAQQEYQSACNSYRAACSTLLLPNEQPAKLTKAQEDELNVKQGKVATAQAELDKYSSDQCQKDAKKDINDKLQQGGGNSNSGGGGGSIAPRKVIDAWKNGVPNAQMLAVATGETKYLASAPVGVKAGQWQSNGEITVPESAQFSLAQAEYYYDCVGKWAENGCNGDSRARKHQEMAMWNFRWRARLRRYNEPFKGSVPGLDMLAGALNAAVLVKRIGTINPLNSLTVQNASLLKDLGDVLLTTDTKNLIVH